MTTGIVINVRLDAQGHKNLEQAKKQLQERYPVLSKITTADVIRLILAEFVKPGERK